MPLSKKSILISCFSFTWFIVPIQAQTNDYDTETKDLCIQILSEEYQKEEGEEIPVKNYIEYKERLLNNQFNETVFHQAPMAYDWLTKIRLRKKLFLVDEINYGPPSNFSIVEAFRFFKSWDSGTTKYFETTNDIRLFNLHDPEKDEKRLLWCRTQKLSALDPELPFKILSSKHIGVMGAANPIHLKTISKGGKNFKVLSVVRTALRVGEGTPVLQRNEIMVIPESNDDFFNLYKVVDDFYTSVLYNEEMRRMHENHPDWQTVEGSKGRIQFLPKEGVYKVDGAYGSGEQAVETTKNVLRELYLLDNRIIKYALQGNPDQDPNLKKEVLLYNNKVTHTPVKLPMVPFFINKQAISFSGKDTLTVCGKEELANKYEAEIKALQQKYQLSQTPFAYPKGSAIQDQYLEDLWNLEAPYKEVIKECRLESHQKWNQQKKEWADEAQALKYGESTCLAQEQKKELDLLIKRYNKGVTALKNSHLPVNKKNEKIQKLYEKYSKAQENIFSECLKPVAPPIPPEKPTSTTTKILIFILSFGLIFALTLWGTIYFKNKSDSP